MKVIALVKYSFSLVGLGMLVGAFFLYKSTSAFLGEATRTEGTVVALIQSQSSKSTTYRPAINFTTQKGETIDFVSSTGSNPPSYSKGQKVDILYLPAEPQNAEINGFFSLWGGSAILGGMGGAFFLIGAGIFLVPMLKGRRDEYLKKQISRTADQSLDIAIMDRGHCTVSDGLDLSKEDFFKGGSSGGGGASRSFSSDDPHSDSSSSNDSTCNSGSDDPGSDSSSDSGGSDD